MLAHRIIPVLLYKGEALVKGERFNPWRSVGHVQQAVEIYAARGVDELIVLDVSPERYSRGPDFEAAAAMSAKAFTPITIGGGVRSVDDARTLLAAGADKVAVCTHLPAITEISKAFGSQAVCACLDVRRGAAYILGGNHRVAGNDARTWAKVLEECGAGEIMVTDIDREGGMQGYNLDLICEIAETVSVPVVAHGGCSGYQDMLDAIHVGASAVAAGALFQFTDCTPRRAAEFLAQHDVEARV